MKENFWGYAKSFLEKDKKKKQLSQDEHIQTFLNVYLILQLCYLDL